MPKKKKKPTQADQEEAYQRIDTFLHCDLCMKEKPDGMSPANWVSMEVGLVNNGSMIVLWCKRHRMVTAVLELANPFTDVKCACGNPMCGKEEKPAFELGQTVASAGVAALSLKNDKFQQWTTECLKRHHHGDGGDLSPDDKLANFEAIMKGDARVFSSYKNQGFDLVDPLWIITEADRSVTTMLFPKEY